MRRQGSGTYVGRAPTTSLDEGLEKLISYSELARQRGVAIELGELEIGARRLGPDAGPLFGLEPDTEAVTITRVLLMDGSRDPGCATWSTRTSSCPRTPG